MSSSPSLPFRLWLMSKIWKAAILRLVLKGDGAFNRRIADFFERPVPASDQPINGVSSQDITIDSTTDLWVRVFTPTDSSSSTAKLPVIFYLHGGFFAFLKPSTRTVDSFCRKLSRDSSSIIISVHYRRIPEHRYPAAIDDGLNTIKWFQLADNSVRLAKNADLSNSFLMGDSAGGNLAYNVSCKLAEAGELCPVVIRGLVLIQPAFGGETVTESEAKFGDGVFADRRFSVWRWKAYLPPGADKDHPGCNPMGDGCESLVEKWIFPTKIVVGGYCPGQSRHLELGERMKAAGKEVEVVFFSEAVHAFYLFEEYDLTKQCLDEVSKFIKSRCVFLTSQL